MYDPTSMYSSKRFLRSDSAGEIKNSEKQVRGNSRKISGTQNPTRRLPKKFTRSNSVEAVKDTDIQVPEDSRGLSGAQTPLRRPPKRDRGSADSVDKNKESEKKQKVEDETVLGSPTYASVARKSSVETRTIPKLPQSDNLSYQDIRSDAYIKRGITWHRKNGTVINDYLRALKGKFGSHCVDMIYLSSFRRVEAFAVDTDTASKIVEEGIEIDNEIIRVSPLNHSAKYMIKNVMPWIGEDEVKDALKSFGKVIEGTMRREYCGEGSIMTGEVSVSIIKKAETSIPRFLAVKIVGDLHKWYITPAFVVCFNCGKPGHWVRFCETDYDDERVRANIERDRAKKGLPIERRAETMDDKDNEHRQSNRGRDSVGKTLGEEGGGSMEMDDNIEMEDMPLIDLRVDDDNTGGPGSLNMGKKGLAQLESRDGRNGDQRTDGPGPLDPDMEKVVRVVGQDENTDGSAALSIDIEEKVQVEGRDGQDAKSGMEEQIEQIIENDLTSDIKLIVTPLLIVRKLDEEIGSVRELGISKEQNDLFDKIEEEVILSKEKEREKDKHQGDVDDGGKNRNDFRETSEDMDYDEVIDNLFDGNAVVPDLPIQGKSGDSDEGKSLEKQPSLEERIIKIEKDNEGFVISEDEESEEEMQSEGGDVNKKLVVSEDGEGEGEMQSEGEVVEDSESEHNDDGDEEKMVRRNLILELIDKVPMNKIKKAKHFSYRDLRKCYDMKNVQMSEDEIKYFEKRGLGLELKSFLAALKKYVKIRDANIETLTNCRRKLCIIKRSEKDRSRIKYGAKGEKLIPECSTTMCQVIRTLDQAVDERSDEGVYDVKFFEYVNLKDLHIMLDREDNLNLLRRNGRLWDLYDFWLRICEERDYFDCSEDFHARVLTNLKKK